MPTTTAIIAGTGASLTGIGTVAWSNSGNIVSSNNSYADCNLSSSAVSRWLVATGFDFSTIPDDAEILGVMGTVEAKYAGTNAASLTAASFVVGGAVVGTQKTLAQALTTSDTNYTVGGAADLWGYPITPMLLKVSTTGWAISCTGGAVSVPNIDAMWLTVTYMVAGRTFRTRRVRRANRH